MSDRNNANYLWIQCYSFTYTIYAICYATLVQIKISCILRISMLSYVHQSQPKRKHLRITHLPSLQSKNVFLAFFSLILTRTLPAHIYRYFPSIWTPPTPPPSATHPSCHCTVNSNPLGLFLLSAAFLLCLCLFLPVWSQDSGQCSD